MIKNKNHCPFPHDFLFPDDFELFMLSPGKPYTVMIWIFLLFLMLQRIQQQDDLLVLFFTALLVLKHYPFYFRFQAVSTELVLLFLSTHLSFPGSGVKEAGSSAQDRIRSHEMFLGCRRSAYFYFQKVDNPYG